MTATEGTSRTLRWTALALLLAIWIGWTVYVWSENGADAGIGVLISWPAVFAALALLAAPLIGVGLLMRRQRTADGRAESGEVAAPADAPGTVLLSGPPITNPVSKRTS